MNHKYKESLQENLNNRLIKYIFHPRADVFEGKIKKKNFVPADLCSRVMVISTKFEPNTFFTKMFSNVKSFRRI